MIFIRMSGGIGNQLFQYAFARKIKETNAGTVKLDTSYFDFSASDNITKRSFTLDKFNITLIEANFFEIFSKKINDKFFLNVNNIHDIDFPNQFTFDLNKKGYTYLFGNWLSPKYFDGIRDQLLREITLKETFSTGARKVVDMVEIGNSVSIHVRRGDYLKHTDKFVILGEDYYREAVKKVSEKIDNPKFFVFSDDIDYVRNTFNFLPSGTFFVSNPKIPDYEELMLMAKCKHNIIANSSFSWWGAWLNSNKEKVVVAPSKSMVDSKNRAELIPDNLGWLKI